MSLLTDEQHTQIEEIIKHGADKIIKPATADLASIDIHDDGIDKATQSDLEMEHFLRTKMLEIIPTADFICEESVKDASTGKTDQKKVIRILEETTGYLVVIDPIDGTNFFVKNESGYGVILGVMHRQTIGDIWKFIASFIYDVKEDEMITSRSKAPDVNLTNKPMVNLGYERRIYDQPEIMALAPKNLSYSQIAPPAVRDIIDCFNGIAHGFVGFELGPWDMFAGVGLLQKIGFMITDWYGEPYEFTKPFNGIIVGRTPTIHKELNDFARKCRSLNLL